MSNESQENLMNQQIERSILHNKWLPFTALPKETQQRVLNLEQNDGEYFKELEETGIAIFGILVEFGALTFGLVVLLFLPAIARQNGYMLVWFSGLFVLLMWAVFLIFSNIKQFKMPIKSGKYITPTQFITSNGREVSYFELKDVQNPVEITEKKVRSRVGNVWIWKTYYRLNFDNLNSVSFTEQTPANQWCQKFNYFINYSKKAFQEKNSDFLNSWDTFQGVLPNAKTITQKGCYWWMLIPLLLTFVIPSGAFIISFSSNSRNFANDRMKVAERENTVTAYRDISDLPISETKINSFYDEAISKVKANQTADKSASVALIEMLENARKRKDNNVNTEVVFFSNLPSNSKTNSDDFLTILEEKFKANFPNEVLKIRKEKPINTKEKSFLKLNIEDAKPAQAKNSGKFDFRCELKLDIKTLDSFELKSATFDGFLAAFSKRLGLEK